MNINVFVLQVDAVQVEINPFVETPQGQVVSVDAKIGFDDNAKFRQQDISLTWKTQQRVIQERWKPINTI